MTAANGDATEAAAIDRDYWEDDLQMCLDPWLSSLGSENHTRNWVGKLNKQQLRSLCSQLKVPCGDKAEERRDALSTCNGALTAYFLVDRFAYRRMRIAVTDYSATVLPVDVMEACRLNENEFDVQALLFELYGRDPDHLRAVFHLEKVHSTGFARMKLSGTARRPRQTLKDFLTDKVMQETLAEFDAAAKDGRRSRFESILPHRDHHLVFVRREERRTTLLRSQHAVHGFKPEWIVLDFHNNGKRVDISSVSMSVPLELANRIASKYFGCPCEYENEVQVTPKALIVEFVETLKQDECKFLTLVEITAKNSPLDGAPGLRISGDGETSIGESVRHFENAVGDITSNPDLIKSIKVLYGGKRVKVLLQPFGSAPDGYVVEYVDRTLNAIERTEFESKLMKKPYGLRITSTEKRHKK